MGRSVAAVRGCLWRAYCQDQGVAKVVTNLEQYIENGFLAIHEPVSALIAHQQTLVKQSLAVKYEYDPGLMFLSVVSTSQTSSRRMSRHVTVMAKSRTPMQR